jgi:hypothetical protein
MAWRAARQNAHLRAKALAAASSQRELAELRRRVADAARAGEASQNDLTRGHSEQEELAGLRAEISELAAELERRKTAIASEIEKRKAGLAAAADSQKVSPPVVWTNVGRAQPLATFKSVLWAIQSGEVDSLAGMIAFDGEATAEAERFFNALPQETREKYRDPQRLVASMMASETRPAFTTVEETRETMAGENEISVDISMLGANPKPRTATLRFRQSAAGWQLFVPAKVIEGYRFLVAGVPQSG